MDRKNSGSVDLENRFLDPRRINSEIWPGAAMPVRRASTSARSRRLSDLSATPDARPCLDPLTMIRRPEPVVIPKLVIPVPDEQTPAEPWPLQLVRGLTGFGLFDARPRTMGPGVWDMSCTSFLKPMSFKDRKLEAQYSDQFRTSPYRNQCFLFGILALLFHLVCCGLVSAELFPGAPPAMSLAAVLMNISFASFCRVEVAVALGYLAVAFAPRLADALRLVPDTLVVACLFAIWVVSATVFWREPPEMVGLAKDERVLHVISSGPIGHLGLLGAACSFFIGTDMVLATRVRSCAIAHVAVLTYCVSTTLRAMFWENSTICFSPLIIIALGFSFFMNRIRQEEDSRTALYKSQKPLVPLPVPDGRTVAERMSLSMCDLSATVQTHTDMLPLLVGSAKLLNDSFALGLAVSSTPQYIPPPNFALTSGGCPAGVNMPLIDLPYWPAFIAPFQKPGGAEVRQVSTSSSASSEQTEWFCAKTIAKLGDPDHWDFSMMMLDGVSGGRCIELAGYALLERYIRSEGTTPSPLPEIVPETLRTFLTVLSGLYFDLPYHNRRHAALVAHHTASLLQMTGVSSRLSGHMQAGCLVAALGHDAGHPGRTNKYLVDMQHFLAVIYNDKSVLENYHSASVFQALQRAGCNIFAGLKGQKYHEVRRSVIDMVLATDMGEHLDIMARFETRLRADNFDLDSESKSDLRLTLKVIIKAADLGYATLPFDHFHDWTKLVYEEFWTQGDEEQRRGLEVSPLCDRSDEGTMIFGERNADFVELLVKPIFCSLAHLESQLRDKHAAEDEDGYYPHTKTHRCCIWPVIENASRIEEFYNRD